MPDSGIIGKLGKFVITNGTGFGSRINDGFTNWMVIRVVMKMERFDYKRKQKYQYVHQHPQKQQLVFKFSHSANAINNYQSNSKTTVLFCVH